MWPSPASPCEDGELGFQAYGASRLEVCLPNPRWGGLSRRRRGGGRRGRRRGGKLPPGEATSAHAAKRHGQTGVPARPAARQGRRGAGGPNLSHREREAVGRCHGGHGCARPAAGLSGNDVQLPRLRARSTPLCALLHYTHTPSLLHLLLPPLLGCSPYRAGSCRILAHDAGAPAARVAPPSGGDRPMSPSLALKSAGHAAYLRCVSDGGGGRAGGPPVSRARIEAEAEEGGGGPAGGQPPRAHHLSSPSFSVPPPPPPPLDQVGRRTPAPAPQARHHGALLPCRLMPPSLGLEPPCRVLLTAPCSPTVCSKGSEGDEAWRHARS